MTEKCDPVRNPVRILRYQSKTPGPIVSMCILSFSESRSFHLDSFRSSDTERPLSAENSDLLSTFFDPKAPEGFLGWLRLYDPAKSSEGHTSNSLNSMSLCIAKLDLP